MVRLAIADQEKFGAVVLDQTRFTIADTWPLLVARFTGAQLYMLLGSDVAGRLSSWPHIDELIKTAPHFVIALRGNKQADMTEMINTLQETTKLKLQFSLLDPDYATHSSTKIRVSLKQGHIPRSLDLAVIKYIRDNKLYISGAI